MGLLFPQLLSFPQEFSVKVHLFLLCLLLYHHFSFLFLAHQSFKLSPKGVTCNFYILYLKYTKNKSAYTIISNSWEGITIHVYSTKLPQNDPFPIGNIFCFLSISPTYSSTSSTLPRHLCPLVPLKTTYAKNGRSPRLMTPVMTHLTGFLKQPGTLDILTCLKHCSWNL